MKFLRVAAAIGTLSLVSVSLAACSGSGADDDVTLTWWATQNASSISATKDVYQPAIDAFEEETGIKVEMEIIPWSDLYNRILTAVSSGTGPDVLNIGTTITASVEDTGALATATDENLEAMGGSDRFIPRLWDAARVPDRDQAAVPLISLAYNLYYNTEIFAANGITEPPSSWDEFVEVAQQLTQDTDGDGKIDQWGFTFHAGSVGGDPHWAFILGQQLGGEFVDDEGTVTLDSPKMVEAVTTFVDLMATDKVMSPSDSELDQIAESTDQFVAGKAAMLFNQSPAEYFANREFEDWGVGSIPVIEGGKDVQSMVAGTNITVFADSPHQEEAFKFVGFLTSPEQNAKITAGFNALPVVVAGYDEPEFTEMNQDVLSIRRDAQENHSAPYPMVPNIGEIEQGLGNAMRDMFQAYATGKDLDISGRLTQLTGRLNG